MLDDSLAMDVRVLDRLLAEVVSTQEKLDIVACLSRSSGAVTVVTIAAHVGLPWVVVAESLRDLHRAGIVATSNEDGAGWWLDDFSPWRDLIGVLARMYETEPHLLMRLIARVELHRVRGVGCTDVPHVIRLRLKHER